MTSKSHLSPVVSQPRGQWQTMEEKICGRYGLSLVWKTEGMRDGKSEDRDYVYKMIWTSTPAGARDSYDVT